MKILRFDSVGGASGNMILGALIDLGANKNTIIEQLKTLGIEDFSLQAEQCLDGGFKGTKLIVDVHDVDHPHRHLADITDIINKSGISDRVKTDSIRVFQNLAKAEATVHNTTSDKIHFHEVGAMDAIIDITGTCIALELLEIDKVCVGPLPLGCGTTECAHGVIPIPVPATLELLRNHPVIQTSEPFELVTPTGAALLTSFNQPTTLQQEFTVLSVGYGYGTRKLKARTNLIRATIMESCNSNINQAPANLCVVLETNIDDTIPELIGSLSDKLLKQGALDVFTTPISMKKQRPATLLTVICHPENKAELMDTIFTESTTFGIREYVSQRTCLERRHIEVNTPYGKVRVKIGSWQDRDITRSPEHADCVKRAEENNVPVRAVYEAAIQAIS